MMFEDDLPRPKPTALEPRKFDGWDVAQLLDYIAALQAEIARAEAAIGSREAHKNAADAFFRTPKP